jgi:threonine dehydratase
MLRLPELEPGAIRSTSETIHPAFRHSPQFVHDALSERLGVPVIVKIETVNPIRCFKGRGGDVAVRALAGEGRIGPDVPVVCASAGNFGQGVAVAARRLGIPAVVFASTRAVPAKIAAMRRLGARVVQEGDDFDAARAAADAHVAGADGGHLLVDGEVPRVAQGAASIAVELTDGVAAGRLPAPAVVSVPVGNGALIGGVGSWFRAALPDTSILGVQAAGASGMTLSWRAGRPIDTPTVETFADGIAARVSIPIAVELMAGRVDDMRLVDDDALRAAQTELEDALGITVEGAAAASWAGLLAGPRPDGPAVVIVTGSNV